jgi:hypothetical protein
MRKSRTDSEASSKYNVVMVEGVILEIAAELHPEHLSVSGLSLKIVSDPNDSREVEAAAQAIRNLREYGLLYDRDAETVEPTPAALRAVALRI